MTTRHLKLTEMASADSGKYLLNNEALNQLDSIVGSIIDATRLTNPTGVEGEAYRVNPTGTPLSAWSTFANDDIAIFFNDAWQNITPITGYFHYNEDTANFEYYDGAVWATALSVPAVGGPVSSTDNAITRWDGTSGAILQDGGITISDNDELANHNAEIVALTAATLTITAVTHAGRVIDASGATGHTITLPNNTTENMQIGTQFTVLRRDAGTVTFAVESGSTITSAGSLLDIVADSGATVIKIASTVYHIVGSLE